MNPLLIILPYSMLGLGSYSSHQIHSNVWKLGFVNTLLASNEPEQGEVIEHPPPEPTRNALSKLSPVETLHECMLSQSSGVKNMKFGGLAALIFA